MSAYAGAKGAQRALRWLANFDPTPPIDANTRVVVREKRNDGAPLAGLFRAGRGPAAPQTA